MNWAMDRMGGDTLGCPCLTVSVHLKVKIIFIALAKIASINALDKGLECLKVARNIVKLAKVILREKVDAAAAAQAARGADEEWCVHGQWEATGTHTPDCTAETNTYKTNTKARKS